MNHNRVTLILNQVDPGFNAGANLPIRTGPVALGGARPRTYSADAKNTAGGAKNVTVDFYGTNTENPDYLTEEDWIKLGSIVIATDGAKKKTDGFVSDDTYDKVKAVISAADAQATLAVNAFVNTGKGA